MSCQFNIKCAFLTGTVSEKNYCTTHKPNTDVAALLYRHINPEKRTIKVAGVLL